MRKCSTIKKTQDNVIDLANFLIKSGCRVDINGGIVFPKNFNKIFAD